MPAEPDNDDQGEPDQDVPDHEIVDQGEPSQEEQNQEITRSGGASSLARE